jgi:DNA (cytosine-5)-methyltransferase 1
MVFRKIELRIYIVGFLEEEFASNFRIPKPLEIKIKLSDILSDFNEKIVQNLMVPFCKKIYLEKVFCQGSMSLSNTNGFNDYFLFNDLRNGHSTIHSWDIIETTERQKNICYLLLKNRRKSAYGNLDGNPLSLIHFQNLDNTVTQKDLDDLVQLNILKVDYYSFRINNYHPSDLTDDQTELLKCGVNNRLFIDALKINRNLKIKNISIPKTLKSLVEKSIVSCDEIRYDFKNTKISTGLYGINIEYFFRASKFFQHLVASDTNDYVTTKLINAKTLKKNTVDCLLKKSIKMKNFRKITKEEACKIQGFPSRLYFAGKSNKMDEISWATVFQFLL